MQICALEKEYAKKRESPFYLFRVFYVRLCMIVSPCLVRTIAVLETLVLALEGFGVVRRFVFVVVLGTAEGAHMVHLLLLLDGALLRLAGLVDSP